MRLSDVDTDVLEGLQRAAANGVEDARKRYARFGGEGSGFTVQGSGFRIQGSGQGFR